MVSPGTLTLSLSSHITQEYDTAVGHSPPRINNLSAHPNTYQILLLTQFQLLPWAVHSSSIPLCVKKIIWVACLIARRLSKKHTFTCSIAPPNTKNKAIKLIIIVLFVFFLCFVPFHVTRTMYYTFRVLKKSCSTLNVVNFTYKVTRPLASINSCINPILYFLAGDNYRRKFKHATWRRKACIQQSVAVTISEHHTHKQLVYSVNLDQGCG
ncbi:P2Y purinoceptor 2-like [Narcine bancroftii]|uniref:P2Y purinoceptor 2-like n=1 Tax=Narcine bancroftii TaxID=1343680 RepID=UPI0038311C0E